ncbi:MAG TPA: dihydrolipoamide acetyltransferase family protein [Anaeromyxobacter sp.]|nr:dihydrolipoamide acetyltransferase family protein [Anaeromyxobacter sp.]
MAQVLLMPRQGNTVESCIIVKWRIAEGDSVAAEAVACEVETDKATFEVPAGVAGVVLKLLRPEGDDVPVLSPIAVIGQAGEDWKAAAAEGPGPAAPAAPVVPAPSARAPVAAVENAALAVSSAGAASPVSPRARKRAAAEAIEAATLRGTGPVGRVIERDVIAAAAARPKLTAAARAAVAAGAPVPGAGTALGGRVGVADLAAARAAPALRPVAGKAVDFPGPFTETPLKGIRKLISERMLSSLSSTAQLTFNMSASASRLQALRARFKSSDPSLGFTEVTIGDLVLYAVSRVLPQFPSANATLEKGVLRTYERIHLALAVDTPRGLMVPVIRNADRLSLRELSAESKRLASACQSGSITPDELSGGTFTVTNLGAFGIESFTPVLYAPQVAILGVDAISQRAVSGPEGSVAFEARIGLSLTVDHQAIDGAPAARILKAFADAIGNVDLLLA